MYPLVTSRVEFIETESNRKRDGTSYAPQKWTGVTGLSVIQFIIRDLTPAHFFIHADQSIHPCFGLTIAGYVYFGCRYKVKILDKCMFD